jgi:hypothetical protein
MAVPRPILLALLGTVLLAATFLATRNARDQAADAGTEPASQQAAAPTPAPEAAPKSKPRTDKSRAGGEGAGSKSSTAKPRTDKAAPRPEKSAPTRKAKRRHGPAALMRAIAGKRPVVLFLYQRGANDDRRVARSVAALRGRTRAAVFSDRIANLGKYGLIATSAGVSRAPSIVIIGKGRRSHLIEGYIDPDALAQRVADAR